ncbi:MAG: Na+/H+ antiporter NhaA [Novosphingobium sp.]|nr:Na+/H+ antiporter NhaA [Novosphingobium sp.]
MTWYRHLPNKLATIWMKKLGGEAAAGLLLIAVAIAAMIAANSPLYGAYHALFDGPLPWTPIPKLSTLNLWIDDALMAVFFFVVGLEIKREVLDGELSSAAKRRLPIFAAIAGMAFPALFYTAIAGTGAPLGQGWAIPAATDIAFALGVLALLAKRVPPSLRLFLLAVAIVDDLGAVAIIALFYTAKIKMIYLAGAGVALVAMIVCNRFRVSAATPYLILGAILWYFVLHSGVHATVAGVLAAFTIPMRLGRKHDCLLLRLEHALAPWNGYLIVPAFGFANAGVSLAGMGVATLFEPLPLAIACGLILGKQVGIFAAIIVADRTGFAPRPAGASWMQLWGTSALCGIGFTMSLFIGALAFPGYPELYEQAKIGVLAGSLISVFVGFTILRLVANGPQKGA